LIKEESIRNFILICLSDESKRPTAIELLNHEFLTLESELDKEKVALHDSLCEVKLTKRVSDDLSSNNNDISLQVDPLLK